MVSLEKSGSKAENFLLLSQLHDFDQEVIIGDAVRCRKQNVMVSSGPVDKKFIADNNEDDAIANESTMNVQTLQKCLAKWIGREMPNIADTVEDGIETVILTAIDKNITTRIELAVRSKNASSGRDAVSANRVRGEHMGITASFGNQSESNKTFRKLNANDETCEITSEEVSELSVP